MNIFGGDIGFKNFKGAMLDRSISFTFANVIGEPTALEITGASRATEPLEDLSLIYDKRTYYVAAKAIRHASNHRHTFLANKIDKIDETIKLLAALGLLADQGIEHLDLFVTTVPVEEYHLVREQTRQTFCQTYEYQFRGRKVTMPIRRVEVIPQGAGDYYDYILDEHGQIVDSRVLPKTLIINIGYRTTEIVTMNFGKFSRSESTTLYTAMNSIHKELRRRIVQEYGIIKDLTQMDDIYINGVIDRNGEEYDITDLREEACVFIMKKLLAEIPVWVNPNDVHQIILGGGDADGLRTFFDFDYDAPVHVTGQMGNARGAYKYGRLITNG